MADLPPTAASVGRSDPSRGDATAPGEVRDLRRRWRSTAVLKRDVFSTVERGVFTTPQGEVEAVLRRVDEVPWWTWPIARHFLKREARALALAGPLGVAPSLLHQGRNALVRSWMPGVALHIAKPVGDAAYFKSAKRALRQLHRSGVCHNDLAKEQNWLRAPDGRALLTDFQLAMRFSGRGWAWRLAAYEDLRHLLKHKRRYAPQALTSAERRVLARKSLVARLWMRTGKRVYVALTRGVLGYTDREGAGPRLVRDAPRLAAALSRHPAVRDVAILPFPDRRSGTGLYAFVEADGLSETELRGFARAAVGGTKMPEVMQLVPRLPRDAHGEPRSEILGLVAMNQIDLVDALVTTEAEREIVGKIVAGRQNLRDRFNPR